MKFQIKLPSPYFQNESFFPLFHPFAKLMFTAKLSNHIIVYVFFQQTNNIKWGSDCFQIVKSFH